MTFCQPIFCQYLPFGVWHAFRNLFLVLEDEYTITINKLKIEKNYEH